MNHPIERNAAIVYRKHLGVISAASIALGSSATSWDIHTTATAVFGITPTSVNGTTLLLWPGDGKGVVKYTGTGNDRDMMLQAVGGINSTNVINGVYGSADLNLDGSVIYTGTNNDRDLILQTIGGVVPTATRLQQLP